MNVFRMSGLFMVMIRTGPSASTMSCSGTSYIDRILSLSWHVSRARPSMADT